MRNNRHWIKSHPFTFQTGAKNLWRVKAEYGPGQEETHVTGKRGVFHCLAKNISAKLLFGHKSVHLNWYTSQVICL